MPVINRTERQVRIDGKPLPYDTGRGGQAIGEGISALGAAVSKFGAQQDEQEMFDARMKVSEYTFQQAKEADDKIANYNPAKDGPPGEFDQRFVEERAAKDQAFAEQFKSPKAKQYAMLHTQTARQSAAMRAQNARQGFVQQENIGRITAMVGNAGEAIDGEPETVAKAQVAVSDAIDAVPGLTPAQRNALRDKSFKDLWGVWLKKADENQLQRGLEDYKRGVGEWSKQFQGEADKPVGGEVRPGARNIREDASLDGRTAAVRYNNPGAQYPSAAAEKFGMTGYGIIGGGHKIAMFPSDVHGGAANMDNFARGYRGMTVASAVAKWRGGNGSLTVPQGFDPGEKIDDAFLGDKARMTDFFDKMSRHEGRGKAGPLSSDTWAKSYDMYRSGGIGATPAKAPAVGAMSQSPESETPSGEVPVPIQKFALPDSARPRDHAINTFSDLVPQIEQRLEKYREFREGQARLQGMLNGEIPVDKFDPEVKKAIDGSFRAVNAGERIMKGDPQALAMVGPSVDRLNYLPAPLFGGLHSLIDSPDTGKQALGYTVLGNVIDKNPNALMGQGADEVAKRVEHFRIMSKYYGTEKALKLIAEEGTPEFKERKKALKVDVDKIMKKYEGDNAVSTIEGEMADGKISWLFSRPDVEYNPQQRAVAVNDFRTIYRRELEATGSEERAKAAAVSAMKQTYGETNLFGRKRATIYPMERIYAPVEGSYKHIEDEIKKEIGTYIPSAKMDTITVTADARTLKEIHDMRAGRGGSPSYVVGVERKDGRWESRRFTPDPLAATGSKAAFEAERAKAPTQPTAKTVGAPEGGTLPATIAKEVGGVIQSETDRATKRLDKANKAADEITEKIQAPGITNTSPPVAPLPLGTPRRRGTPSVGGN